MQENEGSADSTNIESSASEQPVDNTATDGAAPAAGQQPTAAQQQWIDQATLDKSYQTLNSQFDRRFSGVEEKLGSLDQIGSTVSALAPLAAAFQQAQQASTPDPVATNPLEAIRQTREQQSQLGETLKGYEEQISNLTNLVNTMQSQYVGNVQTQMVDQQFEQEFGSKEDLEKAKGLAGGVYKEHFTALYNANKGDAVTAFGQFLSLLKSGTFNDQSQETQDVVNALNREKQHRDNMTQFGQPQGVQASSGQGSIGLDSFTF